jgi:hypothetical protein
MHAWDTTTDDGEANRSAATPAPRAAAELALVIAWSAEQPGRIGEIELGLSSRFALYRSMKKYRIVRYGSPES